MPRMFVVALVTLGLVLLSHLTLTPANATSSDFENYFWGFAELGSNEIVCKKAAVYPQKQLQDDRSNRQVVQMYSTSTVVSDRYCANSAKPLLP